MRYSKFLEENGVECIDTPGRLHNNADPLAQWIDCPVCDGYGYIFKNTEV